MKETRNHIDIPIAQLLGCTDAAFRYLEEWFLKYAIGSGCGKKEENCGWALWVARDFVPSKVAPDMNFQKIYIKNFTL
ncbi:hypothetical protein HQN84_02565 [Pedobacter steynii]|nr:hypothetical protein [Pedobacter steynii]NQX37709.1 hypothetical protein [Pedobacter steynii]